jgi:uncharacterized RDD family membrane protein YckC
MSLPDETFSIDTPENVIFGYDVAGIGSRFLAGLVDGMLTLILQTIVLFTIYVGLITLLNDLGNMDENVVLAIIGIVLLIEFGIYWGYYIFFEVAWNGQSPGKRWVGLRVIRGDGTPIGLSESIIRNLMRIIDFLPVYYGLGIIVMFFNRQSRRLGDLVADTLVIHDHMVNLKKLVEDGNMVLGAASLNPIEATADGMPIGRLTNQEIQMAEDFLRRRENLPNHINLAYVILKALYTRMGINDPLPQAFEVEDKIVAIVRATRKNTAQ